jgi:hypothetical protein
MLILAGTCSAIVAAVAAIWTLIYAKDAPTKEDLKRVEEHTAATSHHLESLNERSSSEDEYGALYSRAGRVPITVRGTADSGQPLTIYLRTNDPTVRFSRVELLNDMGSYYGKAECSKTTNSMEFSFTLEPDAVTHWLSGSTPIGSDIHLTIKVYMFFEGVEPELYRRVYVESKGGILKRDPKLPSVSFTVVQIEGQI